MSLAFCILSHGKPLLTSRCVDNLSRHGASNIIILDNGSGADDFSLLTERANHKATIRRSESNLGITRGRIALADIAEDMGARRIVFLDNDQFPTKQAMSAYECKPQGHLLGAEAWAINQDFKPVSMVWGDGEHFTYVGCGGLCVDVDDWKAVGGFDPQFSPYYFEDPDFCLRAFDMGFSMHPMRKDFVVHEAHSTLSGKKDRMAMFLSNYVKFRNKWSGRRDLLQRGVISWG
jgi:GT2 family glycosyltransferase